MAIKRDKMKKKEKKPTEPSRKNTKGKKEKSKTVIGKNRGGIWKKPLEQRKAKSKKSPELRVLILEDNAVDAELMERQLRRDRITFRAQRTASRGGFIKALSEFTPDLILADYTLPKFNALQALELCRVKAPFTPFIVITGSISEEVAVKCMKQGADDYLLKDRLARLGEAVRHSLANRRLQKEKNAAEEMLKERESRIQSIFRSAPTGIGVVSNRIFLQVNKRMCELTGYAEDELIGQSSRMLYPSAKEFKRVGKYKYEQIKEFGTGSIETQFLRKDGKLLDIFLRSTPIDEHNLSTGITFTALDISESKRAHEQIAQAAQKWTTTFDSIQDGILLLNADQTVLQANQAFADLVNKPFKEIIGKKCFELVHADRQPDPQCPFARSAKSKKRKFMELEIKGRIFRIITDPLKQNSRAFSGAVHIMTDITEQKRIESALLESREQFRIAQDMSPDGFTILQPVRDAQERVVDFTWVYENAAVARLNGTDPEAVVGKRLLELFPGHRGTPILRAYQKVAESGETCILEADYSGESMSKPTSFRIVVVPMTENIAILAQDITDRKQAEKALNEMNEIFRLFLKHNPIYVFIKDENIRPIYLSKNFGKMLGRPL